MFLASHQGSTEMAIYGHCYHSLLLHDAIMIEKGYPHTQEKRKYYSHMRKYMCSNDIVITAKFDCYFVKEFGPIMILIILHLS